MNKTIYIALLFFTFFTADNLSYAQQIRNQRFTATQLQQEQDIDDIKQDLQNQQVYDSYKMEEKERMEKTFSKGALTAVPDKYKEVENPQAQNNQQTQEQKGALSMGPLEYINRMREKEEKKSFQNRFKGYAPSYIFEKTSQDSDDQSKE